MIKTNSIIVTLSLLILAGCSNSATVTPKQTTVANSNGSYKLVKVKSTPQIISPEPMLKIENNYEKEQNQMSDFDKMMRDKKRREKDLTRNMH